MHYWVDLQSVHGFRCYDNIARTRNVSDCLYSLYAWLFLLSALGMRAIGKPPLESIVLMRVDDDIVAVFVPLIVLGFSLHCDKTRTKVRCIHASCRVWWGHKVFSLGLVWSGFLPETFYMLLAIEE